MSLRRPLPRAADQLIAVVAGLISLVIGVLLLGAGGLCVLMTGQTGSGMFWMLALIPAGVGVVLVLAAWNAMRGAFRPDPPNDVPRQ
jgi:hypothetical protein